MKHGRLKSIVAGLAVLAFTAPLSAQAASTFLPAAGGPLPQMERIYSQVHAAGEYLEFLRLNYTGAGLRMGLAASLMAQKQAIGIEPEQEQAWDAYADAVLAMVPERETVISIIGEPGSNDIPEAFARAEAIAASMIDRAGKAEELKAAIGGLRASLTPEQLEAARVPRLRIP